MISYCSGYTLGFAQPVVGRKVRKSKRRTRTKKSILHRHSLRASGGVQEAAGDTEAANINQSPMVYDDMF